MATTAAHKNNKLDQPTFVWEGVNKNGVKIRGENQASNENFLRAELRRQGISPKIIKKKSNRMTGGKIKPIDIAQFARQLTTMMRAGVPMVQSLELISTGNEKPAMRELIKKITKDIEAGEDLAGALSNHPLYFDSLFVNLIRAGEQAGTLEDMIDKVAMYKEKTERMKAKVKKAMMYPIIVVVAAVVVSVIMLVWVIPTFKDIFEGFGADLPAFTLWVIGLSEWLQATWWLPLSIIIGGSIGFTQARRRSKKFHRFVDRLSLKIPLMGLIINKSSVARFARTLSTMFAAGVPLVEAMDAVAGATGNVVYEEATLQIKEDTSKGVQLHVAMTTTQEFPSMVVQMTKIGEESGRLEEMLDKVADYYEEQVDDLVDTLSKQMEPMIMAVLGVLIGGLVVAMYLPIFKMGAAVG
jgi:type IV pilus assembly protein PilC